MTIPSPYGRPELPSGAPIPAQSGIGLRFPHQQRIATERPDVGWLEVHPENYLGDGPAGRDLLEIRRDYPISLHATGLSLGSDDGLDQRHLAAIADLAHRVEPGLISDHLSWSSVGGVHLPDLLPSPLTRSALDVFARNIDQVQTALGGPILVENPSTYLRFADDEMSEAEFLAALVRRTGCGLLLDVNNIFVSAMNLGESPADRLRALLDAAPATAFGEIHLAGHATRLLEDAQVLRIDDHGSRVADEVWNLFQATVERIGPRPSLVEWDTNLPPLELLLAEALTAQAVLDQAYSGARA